MKDRHMFLRALTNNSFVFVLIFFPVKLVLVVRILLSYLPFTLDMLFRPVPSPGWALACHPVSAGWLGCPVSAMVASSSGGCCSCCSAHPCSLPPPTPASWATQTEKEMGFSDKCSVLKPKNRRQQTECANNKQL